MRHLLHSLPAATLALATGFFCVTNANSQEHLIGQQPAANRVIKLRSALAPLPIAVSPSTSRTARDAENASGPSRNQIDGKQTSPPVPAVLRSINQVPPRVAEQAATPQKLATQPKPLKQTAALNSVRSDESIPAAEVTKPLSVTKSGPAINTMIEAPGYINLNQTATLRIKLQNVGDTTANSIKLIATLPAHAKFSRATPTPTRVDGQRYEFQLSNLGSRQTRDVTLELIPTEKIPLDIGTEVVVENTQRIAVGVRQPKIKLSLQGPSEANMGQSLIHKVLMENTGDGMAQDIQLVAKFPEQLQSSKKDQVTIPILQPGQSVVVELPTLCKSAGPAELNVSVAAVGIESQTVKANIFIHQPELEVSAVGPQMNFVNREGIYTIKLDNTGEVDASNVKIQLNVPRGMEVTTISREATVDPGSGVLVWTFDRIPAKTEQSIMLKTLATDAGEQICHIKVQSNETREKDIQLTTLVAARADLSLSVKNQSGPIQAGGKAQFLIVVENKGSSTAENVSIVVELPESFVANQQDGVDLLGFGNSVNFQDTKIEPGQKREFAFSAIGSTQGEHIFRGVLVTSGTERKITVEDSVYVYEVNQTRVSEALSPAIPR